MKILPAIDILDQKVVRLREGNYNEITTYNADLTDMIDQHYNTEGTDMIHVIDLNGAKGDFSNQDYLFNIIKKKKVKIQYGGGIRSIDKIKELISYGIERVIIGTQPIIQETFLDELSQVHIGGSSIHDRVVIAIDVYDDQIKYSGWQETSPLLLNDYIARCAGKGFVQFLCTDIAKDGKLGGPGIALYKRIISQFPFIKLIASGGVSTLNDVDALKAQGVKECVVGKAIYEDKMKIEDIQHYNLRELITL